MRIFKERTQWFDIPDDPDKGRLKIRYLNPGEQQRFVAKCRKLSFIFNEDTDTKEGHMVPDENRLTEDGVDLRVIDWENFYGEDGKKLECNRENKIKINDLDGFSDILKGLIKDLDTMVKEERELEVKNLPNSHGGSPVLTASPAKNVS